ncbi:PhzF family phenazine biosynthesis protein [Chitinophaga sp. sic0106]|uniref:PhzF family phenazine biosynthesis protein n=1 Tax=Chitinophaga sp. sic0106 TaxID=2854785 RepID=UPI001C444BAE|nr:PhzF family phenazine biosynthesis protein [Chitinophaga sp. sic0106]MBV7532063.1 PhzF family phenazine biosynthesis protein [Chitinophaga sp. sic0106]
MQFRYFQADAFTATPFKGNPAGVCLLDEMPSDDILSGIGKELQLPMAAFLLKQDQDYQLRWFSPAGTESQLCGHATLASAHILWETGAVPTTTPIRFHTVAGVLTATRSADSWITLDFPAFNAIPDTDTTVFTRIFPELKALYRTDGGRYLVELPDEAAVKNYQPDFHLIGTYKIIITALADAGKPYDFVSRFFSPVSGVPEDSVTGSAHSALVPFYAKKLGKTSFNALQVSPRGGELRVALKGDRVEIAGQAVTVVEGKLQC